MPHSTGEAQLGADSLVRGVWTSDEGTMAAETARTRWPGIVKKMIMDVEASKLGLASDKIVNSLQTLKQDIEQDRPLTYVCLSQLLPGGYQLPQSSKGR